MSVFSQMDMIIMLFSYLCVKLDTIRNVQKGV
jgi:hypothetical protein